MNEAVIFNNFKSGYAPEQINQTMTVGELIDFLSENYDEETPIYISNDNGYTYGGITAGQFEIEDLDELNR